MISPTVLTPYFVGQLRRPGLLSWLAWLNVLINGALAFWLVPGRAEIGGAFALVGTQLIGTAIVFGVYLKCSGATFCEATLMRRDDVTVIRGQLANLLRQAGTNP
jgi:hypothetical protein